MKTTPEIRDRLEQLRRILRNENISYGELAELQSLALYIDRGDVELLEAAGVPEHHHRKPNAKLRRKLLRLDAEIAQGGRRSHERD